jgi:N-methylhydantoinase B
MRSKGSMIDLPAGTLVTQVTAGGGGWGDPHRRDPSAVAADVRGGYVSAAAARDVYHVVLCDDGDVDISRTDELRGAS